MGNAKGKNDITGIVRLAMFGCHYEIPDKDKEDENKKIGRRSSEPSSSLGVQIV